MRARRRFKYTLMFLLMVSIIFSINGTVFGEDETYLVIDEQSGIVIGSAATEQENLAAEELQTYIKQLIGLELTVTDDVYDVQGVKLYIGSAAPSPELDRIRAGGEQPESFRLHITDEFIQLVGLSDRATRYAVYELLEQLGVRWFMPGEIGTVVPTLDHIRLEQQDTIQHPGFSTRILQSLTNYPRHPDVPEVYDPREAVDWARYMRLGGENYGRHGFPGCSPSSSQRPDLFILENGVPTRQLDVTHPEVLDCVVEGALNQLRANPTMKYVDMGPNDGLGFGQTEWDADDFDPMSRQNSVTDRYVKFYNLVLAELKKEFPDVGIAFYAYSLDIRPPVREIPHPDLMPVLAPITFDRIHAIGNSLSWERNYLKEIIDGWHALGVENIMYRGYLFNLADPGLPFSSRPLAEEFAYFKENSIDRVRVETSPSWGYHAPGLYLAAKMMWDPELDVEAVMDDYFVKFYGPAAESMKEHFAVLEETFEEADYFAGSIADFPKILTQPAMRKLERSLRRAEARVRGNRVDPVYAQRVAMIRTAYDFGDTFLEMLAANNRFDFVEAKNQLDQVNDLSLQAISHSPVILYTFAQNYIMRFWGNKIEDGYDRVTNGNQIVAKLPDEWSVFLDPSGGGEQLGLWRPWLGTQSWMKLKTYSESWSSQGLRYYLGHAWYRTTVNISNEFSGQSIHLWLQDVDESAKVWVNGIELPLIKKGSALQNSWEFNATDAVEFGTENVVVVDVGNMVLNELGTGGIVGPAMFYMPAE